MEPIETFEHCGMTVELHYDHYPIDPRKDYDHAGIMVCFHWEYNLGDATDLDSGSFESWGEVREYLVKEEGARVIVPLYLIDHSGISMRAGRDFQDCDPGGWDSGQVGFIYMDGPSIRECFQVQRVTKVVEARARECLMDEVAEYNSYLTGECYGYVVEDPHGEVVDSCWGFLGELGYGRTMAEAAAEYCGRHWDDELNRAVSGASLSEVGVTV